MGLIRQATLADLDALCALEAASFVCDGVDRRAMAGFLRSGAAVVLLAEGQGRVNGLLREEGAGRDESPLRGEGNGQAEGLMSGEGNGQAEGPLIGHLVLRFNARHRIARVYSIAVAAAAQGQGVGRALVAAAEAHAIARGRNRMRLEIAVDNLASQALFAACGYKVFGHYDEYYEDGGAALRLEKTLM